MTATKKKMKKKMRMKMIPRIANSSNLTMMKLSIWTTSWDRILMMLSMIMQTSRSKSRWSMGCLRTISRTATRWNWKKIAQMASKTWIFLIFRRWSTRAANHQGLNKSIKKCLMVWISWTKWAHRSNMILISTTTCNKWNMRTAEPSELLWTSIMTKKRTRISMI